jgi:hypothetical protein
MITPLKKVEKIIKPTKELLLTVTQDTKLAAPGMRLSRRIYNATCRHAYNYENPRFLAITPEQNAVRPMLEFKHGSQSDTAFCSGLFWHTDIGK